MKVLGIIGGVSWHSTAECYKQLNLKVAAQFGARHSARVLISSLDFADLLSWQRDPDERRLREAFISEGLKLKAAGCDAFIIASHTLSWLGEDITNETGLKHLCLYDAVARRLTGATARKIGLVGTKYTMKDRVYRDVYSKSGFEIVTPNEPHLTRTATIVYKELVNGLFLPDSRTAFYDSFNHLAEQGVDAIILGCTEIGLLIHERHWSAGIGTRAVPIPLIDLIEVHTDVCIDWFKTGRI